MCHSTWGTGGKALSQTPMNGDLRWAPGRGGLHGLWWIEFSATNARGVKAERRPSWGAADTPPIPNRISDRLLPTAI